MIPRINTFEINNDWKLLVTFDDGFRVCYDVKDDIDTIEDFKSLTSEIGLWEMAQLDSSRTCTGQSDCVQHGRLQRLRQRQVCLRSKIGAKRCSLHRQRRGCEKSRGRDGRRDAESSNHFFKQHTYYTK